MFKRTWKEKHTHSTATHLLASARKHSMKLTREHEGFMEGTYYNLPFTASLTQVTYLLIWWELTKGLFFVYFLQPRGCV